MPSKEKLERELKAKEIVASTATTVLALYVVVFSFLGKSLFTLTLLGFWIVFLPVWLLAISAILCVSSIIYNKHIRMDVILIFYSIGVVAIPIALTLIYSYPSLFWAE